MKDNMTDSRVCEIIKMCIDNGYKVPGDEHIRLDASKLEEMEITELEIDYLCKRIFLRPSGTKEHYQLLPEATVWRDNHLRNKPWSLKTPTIIFGIFSILIALLGLLRTFGII